MDDNKLKELILYIAENCKDDSTFGLTKLNKILFLADMGFYAYKGDSISGAMYMHKPNGPVVKRLLPALEALKREKRADLNEIDCFGYKLKKVVALKPNAPLFSFEELSLVDWAIEKTRHMNATELSIWSHGLKPWLITKDKEEIPYFSVFVLRHLPVEKDGIEWGKKELRKLGLITNAA